MLEQLLSQQMGDNPQMQAMLTMMQMNAKNNDDGDGGDPHKNARPDEAERLRHQLGRAANKVRQLQAEVGELEDRIGEMTGFEEDIAHALGACPFCFGFDHTCRACRGLGKPGAYEPDEALFLQFVQPSIARRAASVRAQN